MNSRAMRRYTLFCRRWLRENDMLDRYADDDDDDRVYWEIPADYQAPRLDPSL